MRFSLLTLNLHSYQEPESETKLKQTAELIARENVTTVCVQECCQRKDGELLSPGSPIRRDNAARVLADRLAEYGQKYDYVWDWSHYGFEHYEEGSAVISQLPILASTAGLVSEGSDPDDAHGSRKVVHARLAVSPEVVIDVYSVHLSDPGRGGAKQAKSLAEMVAETPEKLKEANPPRTSRRGHMKLVPNAKLAPEPVRLVFLAGDFNDTPDGPTIQWLTGSGFADSSTIARVAGSATFEDGRWIDYVLMRPVLRPTAGRVVFDGSSEPRVSDHSGVLLEFEV